MPTQAVIPQILCTKQLQNVPCIGPADQQTYRNTRFLFALSTYSSTNSSTRAVTLEGIRE